MTKLNCKFAITVLVAITMLVGVSLSPAHAKNYTIASSPSVPPYIIPTDQGDTGIEIDIVSEAMKAAGHTAKFVNLPFPRALARLKNGRVDAALTISETAELNIGDIYYSDVHLIFRNVAITLTENNIELNSIADMKDKSVATFEYAKKYLGKKFADMANANPAYREMHPNTLQIPPTLFAKRADVAVIEINIFKYHLKNETYPVSTDAPITIHEVFPPNPFKVAFISAEARDDFNKGLAIIRANGTYQAIFDKYTVAN